MASDLEQRPTKRARSSSLPASAIRSLEHDATFWLNDGTIVLACGEIGYRVHAGVLSMNCGIFKDMLASGTPSAGEVYDGVDVVRLSDEPVDMRLFLALMYTPDEGPMRSKYSVAQLMTLLDMARKYMADRLQKIIKLHLRELFPSDLKRARASYSTLRPVVKAGENSFDPWVAIDISLNHDLPAVLPMALYYSILGKGLQEILDLEVSPAALRKILLFRDSFIEAVNQSSPDGDGYFDVSKCSHDRGECPGVALSIQESAIRYYRNFDDDVFQQSHSEADPDDSCDELCAYCSRKLTVAQREFSEYLWVLLPSMCMDHGDVLLSWTQVREMQDAVDGMSVTEAS